MKNKIKILMLLAFTAVMFASCDDDETNTIASFTFSPEDNIQAGDTVYFTNTSSDATSYEWNFGDGETSTEESPFHIYDEPGIYDVALVAINGSFSITVTQQVGVAVNYSYIINYGSFSGDKSSISAFDKYADEIQNGYYKTVNGVDMVSNVQYAYNFNNNIYLMGNNTDGISWVDSKTFEQTNNAITVDIVKPRYCVGQNDYLYVSCWGGDIWADQSVSYIAKVNLTTNTVEKKIALPGGPEGLAIANDKLYAALNYKDSVAVIDLGSEVISYIETPAVTSFFQKDNAGNLYVSLVSTYSNFSADAGIGYINTSTDELVATYKLDGVSSSYVDIMEPNTDFSKLYVMTSAYDANWNLSGAIAVFDVASGTFESNMLVEGVTGMNGVGYMDEQVFCFVSEAVTGNGKAVTYTESGTMVKEYETGIAPFMLLTAE
jgi:PKD repeat protein